MAEGFSGYQLRSCVTRGGELHLSLVAVETPPPGDGEVVVRVEAAPINPSDLGLLTDPAGRRLAKRDGSPTLADLRAKGVDPAGLLAELRLAMAGEKPTLRA